MSSTRFIQKVSSSATVAVLLLSVAILSVQASDPDPLVDVSPNANETYVLRDVFKNGEVTKTSGGLRSGLNITIFPALTNEGITFTHFRMKPCGENQPHTHPRATEILSMVSGGPIQAGLVDTSGNAHIYILYPGDIILFPRALLHFEVNVGSEEAVFISALNSQNPGVLTAASAYLKLPTRVVAGGLNQDFDTAQKLKNEALTYADHLVGLTKRQGCVPGKGITTAY